ncbi:hypothetical protein PU629_09005 [Pullulanibacillus sp. KACC 23026]|uniref:hypothetical protein n=1 Tax=Pullulanibacillus sp. KACC 23026 TaxID=3028315 RepID=UPI0023AEC961|nr:hypothetical protein [Pullulanibacillus sp. KACC 23026]WEG14474.1 hypothetical protein PU629_09005 [Pullulanibacillus sp. KACC 23026]
MYLSQANSFITCLLAQNPKDQDATRLRGKVAQKESLFEKQLSIVKKILANTNEDVWESLLETEELQEYKFIPNEWRVNAGQGR